MNIEDEYKDALASLREYLLELEREAGNSWDEIDVYCFGDSKRGIRISEISYSKKTPTGEFGSSIMRSDVECLAPILAAEDFLLTFDEKPYRPEGWESDIDEHGDAKFRLAVALEGDLT